MLCLESADSNCTAVSKGGKIQNTKRRIDQSTFFGHGNNTNIFPRKSDLYLMRFLLFLQRNFLTKKGILAPIKGKAKGLPHLVTDHERHKLAVAA